MKKEDTTNRNQADVYPYKATVADDSFEHVFALYRSRVHEYAHSLFTGDFSDEQGEDSDDIQKLLG